MTFSTLLNDGRPHQTHWVDLAMDGESWAGRRPFSFRLLRLTDAEDGAAVSATDEAVLLYLQALDTNLADRAMALKLIVERQMVAGEFNRARATAVDARRTAEGLAASLRDKLDDTRRDVRSVDWAGEMPDWLSGTLAQLGEQLDMGRQLLSLAATAGENRPRRRTAGPSWMRSAVPKTYGCGWNAAFRLRSRHSWRPSKPNGLT